MENENKYYTPTIEELFTYIVNEREICLNSSDSEINKTEFKLRFHNDEKLPTTIKAFIEGNNMYKEAGEEPAYTISLNRYRIKYLDTEDIESLGFTKRGKSWAGYIDYEYTELINGEVPYYLKATIHVPLMDNMYKIILHRYIGEGTNIDKQLEQGESELMFKGIIKNKSELKTIMKQVGIL